MRRGTAGMHFLKHHLEEEAHKNGGRQPLLSAFGRWIQAGTRANTGEALQTAP